MMIDEEDVTHSYNDDDDDPMIVMIWLSTEMYKDFYESSFVFRDTIL